MTGSPGPGSHYFDAAPTAASAPREVRWAVDGVQVVSRTDAGVFAGDRLDPGTAVLLERGPLPRGQVLLDLGCGWGPIAIALARRVPEATVWAVDVNERARALCRANADSAGLGGQVRVSGPEGVPADVVFDEIWSNPPIRIGKQALHALLLQWLPRLRVGGTASFVVSRNLGADSLATWLLTQRYDVRRLASARGYRVLAVRGRSSSASS